MTTSRSSPTAAIRFERVGKKFFSARARGLLLDRMRRALTRAGQSEPPAFSLRDLTFDVADGESLAVVGRNASGKTTLLSLIAGLCLPDSGKISVAGHVVPVMELGSGFHPDLTGRENIVVNAALLGARRRDALRQAAEIGEFAGLREFLAEPLRTYSAGMVLRLAFAVAMHADPEILIVDEVLAVGDLGFQERCLQSVTANTREDARELLELAAAIPIRTRIQTYPLEAANEALIDLKRDRVRGSAVLEVAH